LLKPFFQRARNLRHRMQALPRLRHHGQRMLRCALLMYLMQLQRMLFLMQLRTPLLAR
jgi:hypothetical protein